MTKIKDLEFEKKCLSRYEKIVFYMIKKLESITTLKTDEKILETYEKSKNEPKEDKKLIKPKNIHIRDQDITFDEGPHIYTILGDSNFTSVTTWVHTHFKKFDADMVIGKMMKSKRWPSSPYFGMTVEAIKDKWDKNRDGAASSGTNLHYDIECHYNDIPVVNDSIEWKYF